MTQPDKIRIYNSPANGSDALYKGWERRVWTGRNWVKLYLFSIIALVNSAVFLFTTAGYDLNVFQPTSRDYYFFIWVGISVAAFIFVRINLAMIPGLIAIQDFNSATWSLLRSTTIRTWEIMVAILKSAVSFTVPYFALLNMFAILIVNVTAAWGTQELPKTLPFESWLAIFLGLIGLAFALVALGYIGGFIIRRPLGVVIGIIAPLILLIFVGLGSAASISLGNVPTEAYMYPGEFLALLLIPEMAFRGILIDLSMNTILWFYPTWLNLAAFYWVTAAVFWGILYFVIRKQRA